jgi:hypothetical protein
MAAVIDTGPEEIDAMAHPIEGWHAAARARDASALPALLADDVVFHSPVVHTPQRGREITAAYLAAALQVLGNASFRYVREILGERDALLEFECEIDGIAVNGVDLVRFDDAGRIVEFKVMVRPLKAMQIVHQKMGEMLRRLAAGAALPGGR